MLQDIQEKIKKCLASFTKHNSSRVHSAVAYIIILHILLVNNILLSGYSTFFIYSSLDASTFGLWICFYKHSCTSMNICFAWTFVLSSLGYTHLGVELLVYMITVQHFKELPNCFTCNCIIFLFHKPGVRFPVSPHSPCQHLLLSILFDVK